MYFEITTSIYPGNTSSGYLVSCLVVGGGSDVKMGCTIYWKNFPR